MKKLFIFLFCLTPLFLISQTDSLKKSKAERNRYFTFIYDNDLFGRTDRYYTQGVKIKLVAPFVKYSPLSKILLKYKSWDNYYGLSLEQDCFTPKSILFDTVNKLDRPYAGTFIVSHFVTSVTSGYHSKFSSGFNIGIIGPLAQGEEEQKAIHRATNNDEPLGWKHQMKNDIIINYEIQYEPCPINTSWLEIYGGPYFRLGTLNTDVSLDMNLRTGLMDSYYKNYCGEKNSDGKKFQLFFTAKARAKLVAYNATLQGGLFTDSPHEIPANEISRFVFSSNLGITLAYKRIYLEFLRTYITKEFSNGVDHGWGRCHLTVCF
jgi:hypothetical protein